MIETCFSGALDGRTQINVTFNFQAKAFQWVRIFNAAIVERGEISITEKNQIQALYEICELYRETKFLPFLAALWAWEFITGRVRNPCTCLPGNAANAYCKIHGELYPK